VWRFETRGKAVLGRAEGGTATFFSCLVVFSIKSFASASRHLSEDKTSMSRDLGSSSFEVGGNGSDGDDNPLEKGDRESVGDEDEFRDHSLPPGFSTKRVRESANVSARMCSDTLCLCRPTAFSASFSARRRPATRSS